MQFDQPKNEPLACKDLVKNIILRKKGQLTVSQPTPPKDRIATFFKGQVRPGFWLFNLILLVGSLIKNVRFSKRRSGGVALSSSYRFLLIFIILLSSVCRPTIPEIHHGKKSRSHNEVVIFEESHNAIKSKPLAGSVEKKNLDFENDPVVCSYVARHYNIYSDDAINQNRTFPYCSKLELDYILVGLGEKPVAGTRLLENGDNLFSFPFFCLLRYLKELKPRTVSFEMLIRKFPIWENILSTYKFQQQDSLISARRLGLCMC